MDVVISSVFPYTIDGKTTDGCVMHGIMYVSKSMFEELKKSDAPVNVINKYNVVYVPISPMLPMGIVGPQIKWDDSKKWVFLDNTYEQTEYIAAGHTDKM